MAAQPPAVPPPPVGSLDQRLKELGLATWLITLVGSASLSGFLSTLVQGPSKAGLDDGLTFFTAAVGGFALTVGVALGVAALRRGNITGHAAASTAAVCMAAGIAVANAIGIGAVGWEEVQRQLNVSHGSPLGKLMALVAACIVTYGPIASVQAAICGGLLGHWLDLLRD